LSSQILVGMETEKQRPQQSLVIQFDAGDEYISVSDEEPKARTGS